LEHTQFLPLCVPYKHGKKAKPKAILIKVSFELRLDRTIPPPTRGASSPIPNWSRYNIFATLQIQKLFKEKKVRKKEMYNWIGNSDKTSTRGV